MDAILDKILDNYRVNEGNIISILQDMQEQFGYIPEDSIKWISDKTDIPTSRFFGIATFYPQFRLKPRGQHVVTVCRGTACHVKGSERIYNRIAIDFDIPPGEDTTTDLKFTVEKVNCIGACGIAPIVILNKEVHGNMSINKIMKKLKSLKTKD
jgi:NADH:ubiquinone oxidoreductase subunit E